MSDESKSDVKRILQAIENDISDGRLIGGTRLDERTLSERFSVSRTPVREALLRLSFNGVVEIRPNKGAFVTELSSARLLGMLEVLSELKVYAAKLAARRMPIEDRRKLQELSDRMQAHVDAGDLKRYFECANELHDEIFKGSQNEFLIENVRNIQTCMCGYRLQLAQIMHMPLLTSLEENRNMVAAIVGGHDTAAAHWMREQTELRREEFIDLMTMVANQQSAAREAEAV
jgi:DNA-binding GntR family transcriptional regulator